MKEFIHIPTAVLEIEVVIYMLDKESLRFLKKLYEALLGDPYPSRYTDNATMQAWVDTNDNGLLHILNMLDSLSLVDIRAYIGRRADARITAVGIERLQNEGIPVFLDEIDVRDVMNWLRTHEDLSRFVFLNRLENNPVREVLFPAVLIYLEEKGLVEFDHSMRWPPLYIKIAPLGAHFMDQAESLDMPSSPKVMFELFEPTIKRQEYLSKAIGHLKEDHSGKNVFIMMRLKDESRFEAIEAIIKRSLRTHGLEGLLASDHEYEDLLWNNISVYLFGCEFGIGVLEKLLPDEPYVNPNVMIELGYMLALGKPCLFLIEKSLEIPTNLIGHLRGRFNGSSVESVERTIPKAIVEWVKGLKDRRLLV